LDALLPFSPNIFPINIPTKSPPAAVRWVLPRTPPVAMIKIQTAVVVGLRKRLVVDRGSFGAAGEIPPRSYIIVFYILFPLRYGWENLFDIGLEKQP
jgi:hypothetical protein